MSRIHNPDLAAVFDHIDANIDEHVQNLRGGFSSQAFPILVKAFRIGLHG